MENNYKIIQELRAKIEQLNKSKNQNGAALVTIETMPIVNSNQIKENNKTGSKYNIYYLLILFSWDYMK